MIYDERGNVLVQKRTDPNWPGVTFPGGHVEKGESFVSAVIREVKEETGLDVENLQLCGMKDWIRSDGSRYMVLLYKTNTYKGTLCSSHEGEVYWLPLSELLKEACVPDMDSVLDVLLNEHHTELFYYLEGEEWKKVVK